MIGEGVGLGRTSRADLLPSSRNTDDDAFAPPLVARLERGAHDVYIARAVERVIAPAIRHINQPRLNILPLLQILRRVGQNPSRRISSPTPSSYHSHPQR